MIVVDSNVWIFSSREAAPEHQTAIAALKSAMREDTICINTVVISEVYHKLAVLHGAAKALETVIAVMDDPLVNLIGFTEQTMREALYLASDTGIRINDAMIAAQAMDIDAKVLTDNVKDFRRVSNLKIIPLRERKA